MKEFQVIYYAKNTFEYFGYLQKNQLNNLIKSSFGCDI